MNTLNIQLFNNSPINYPRDKTIQDILEHVVNQNPDHIALVFQERQVTYREFNEQANRLAFFLREKGLRPDRFVGLMVERSVDMLIGMLAILKAGGAYLPIDPEYPRDRITYLLNDSQSQFLLTRKNFAAGLTFKGEMIFLEEDGLPKDMPNIVHVQNPEPVNKPQDLAYAIYTSGSTGKPKGVMIEHASIINLAYSQKSTFEITADERVLQFSSVSFDASVEQIYITLFSGATLVLIDKTTLLDMNRFERFIDEQSLTHIHAVPLFVSSIPVKKYAALKRMIAGGDVCPPSLVRQWTPYCVFYNEYGPTETTVTSIQLRIDKGAKPQTLSIGRPLTNTFLYIVDRNQELVGPGVPGELCIGGDGVARGYMNRPELTAEKFTSFMTPDGPRVIYKTGDLAQWLPDGNVDFLGRIDFQVKIRGFRIETGEIENRILSQQDQKIKDVVVAARDARDGEKYLCAYLVAEHPIDVPALSRKLAQDLPDYMIPSYFLQIDQIPITPTGKVDRQALPDPQIRTTGENHVGPRDELEKKLVDIWADILHTNSQTIGIDDNFFKLGGHSLKAAAIIARVHKYLNVKMQMQHLFDMPVIRKQAEYIKGARIEKYTSLQPVEEKECYPLSSAQKRLYFLHQLNNDNVVYNIPQLEAPQTMIDKEKMEETFRHLIERHDSLRTSFIYKDGEVVQKIHPPDEINFKIEYYQTDEGRTEREDRRKGKEDRRQRRDEKMSANRRKSGPDRRKTGDRRQRQDAYRVAKQGSASLNAQQIINLFVRPFKLGHAPLLRIGVLVIRNSRQLLMMDMHHIISDGLSMEIFDNDFNALYKGQELPALTYQYKDFAEWIAKEEQNEKLKKQEEFWLREFQGPLPVLNLDYDYARPPIPSFDGDFVCFKVDKEGVSELNRLAETYGATLFMIFVSVYNIMLAKLSGQNDIIIGTVSAGRSHSEFQNIIGMFVDTLALRNYPSAHKVFCQFLAEVKQRTLAAFENQNYPFEKLVSKVSPNHDRNRNPLFDVAFNLENEIDRIEDNRSEVLAPLKTRPYQLGALKSKFDMIMIGVQTGEEIEFTIEFNIQLFKRETIQRFIGYFKRIMQEVCERPDCQISEIDMIPEQEKRRILYEFNQSVPHYPPNKTVHALFEEYVQKTPGNCALTFNSQRLTYQEVNEKANQLAHTLRAKGSIPDTLIGIMVDRSFEMVIGILGILKAGGAYFPIDPHYPKDRIDYLFKDSRSRFLLTQTKYMALAGSMQSHETINLESDSLYTSQTHHIEAWNSPHDTAYVIYTSGSTGKPKGVMINHISAVNLLLALDYMYPLQESDTYLLKTAFVFDVSVSEIFGWFFRGGRLAILRQGEEKDPLAIMNAIEKEKVTHLNFVPSMFNVFVNMMDQTNIYKLSSLKYIFLAGEAIFPEAVTKFRDFNLQASIENLYGPTEATVYASWYSLAGWKKGSVPIGRGIDNLKLFILNPTPSGASPMQPIGVSGELAISGIGLARGYLNRPELTFEKFVDPPLGKKGGDKFFKKAYLTGDLCRWGTDGNVDYKGRIDNQVKIRGFRIELGEIESKLSKCVGIKEAVVVARENKIHHGGKYLCAYLLADAAIDVPSIRERLSAELPEYMIPSYFIQLDKIPLTTNGKVDKKMLPEPEAGGGSSEYVAPTNKVEAILAEVWSQILEVEKIGIDDNVFEIGGDSIKTILASGRLAKRGLDVQVNDFFSHKTIRELAPYVKPMEKENEVDISGPSISSDQDQRRIERIRDDYQNYLEKVKAEKWPDLSAAHNYKDILVTGATGYLGAHLVYELLKTTRATLHLPIRGNSEDDAKDRLIKQLSFYFGDPFVKIGIHRLHVIPADLTLECLGQSAKRYDILCNTMDAVVHSAANVKHFGKYDEFYRDNVVSTDRLLDFSTTGQTKDFHFISTIDTGRGDIAGKDHLVFTEYCHDEGQKSDAVYLKSKLGAERHVLAYRESGLHTSIYRAANMTFHSQTGGFQTNIDHNFFYSMLKAFVHVGFWSEEMMNLEFDLSFVNEAARAITLLLTRKKLFNETYHICNPHTLTWTKMMELLTKSGIHSPNLKLKPREIQDRLSQYTGNPDIEKMIERVKVYAWEWEKKEGTLTVPKIDRTVVLLQKIGFEWSKPDTAHIERMISHCQGVGFL
ncbi:MAG: amino acid adenylation domain-containing protein [Candidatus Omnitrophota bacterium]